MPLRAFRCPGDADSWATLDHCRACPNRCAPLPVLAALWEDNVKDVGHYHQDPKAVSVTQILGCLRKAYLTATHDYTETPESLLARWVGTLVHKRLEATASCEPGQPEQSFEIDLGDGYTFRGTADLVSPTVLRDWKFTGYIPTEDPKPDHVQQLRIYRGALTYTGHDVAQAVAEVTYISTKETDTMVAAWADPAGDRAVLDTALERARQVVAVLRAEVEPRTLPREGRSVRFGSKTACDYCAVREFCDALEVL